MEEGRSLRVARLASSLFMSRAYGSPEPLSIYNRNLFARRVRQLEGATRLTETSERSREPPVDLRIVRQREMREEEKVEKEREGGQIDCSFIPRRFKDELYRSLGGAAFSVTCDRILSYPRALISFATRPHSLPVVNAAKRSRPNARFKSRPQVTADLSDRMRERRRKVDRGLLTAQARSARALKFDLL